MHPGGGERGAVNASGGRGSECIRGGGGGIEFIPGGGGGGRGSECISVKAAVDTKQSEQTTCLPSSPPWSIVAFYRANPLEPHTLQGAPEGVFRVVRSAT